MTDTLEPLRTGLRESALAAREVDLLPGVLRASHEIRQRRRRVASAAVAVTALAFVGGGAVTQLRAPEQRASHSVTASPTLPTPAPDETSTPTAAPSRSTRHRSQSQADALRDGVPPDVATLPLAARVDPLASLVTSSGRWVISRIPEAQASAMIDVQMHSPRPPGLLGRDFASPMEYGELLLMDRARTRIIRAFPLHGAVPHGLLVTRSAVYVVRTGVPGSAEFEATDSMVGRYDLRTHSWRVRIMPARTVSHFYPTPDLYVPPGWVVGKPGVVGRDPAHGTLSVTQQVGGTTVRFDPVTLGIVDIRGGFPVPR